MAIILKTSSALNLSLFYGLLSGLYNLCKLKIYIGIDVFFIYLFAY